MSRSVRILAAGSGLLIAGILVWALLRTGGPEVAPAPPPDSARTGPTPKDAPSIFSPEPALLPVPPGALAPPDAEGDAPLEGNPSVDSLVADAFRRIGGLLREFGEVTAYLEADRKATWDLLAVSPEVKEAVFRMLDGEDRGKRFLAALALARMELDPAELALLRGRFDQELLAMKDEAGKNTVLGLSFALITHADPHGLTRLADAIRSGQGSEVKDFRNGAVLVLGLARHRESSPLLTELLAADPDRLVRKHAAQGLGAIGGMESRTALVQALSREQDLEVRAWSALAEGRAAPKGRGDPALLRALAEDPAGEVRGAAAFALSRAGGPGTVPALMDAWYGDDHPFARIGATAGIAKRGRGPEVKEFLENQSSPHLQRVVRESESHGVRFYAARTLAGMPRSESRSETLRAVAAKDSSPWIRVTAIDGIARTEKRTALPYLKERLAEEKSSSVKSHLERTIRRLEKRKR